MGTSNLLKFLRHFGIIGLLLTTASLARASATSLTYQGRIQFANNDPFEYAHASFLFKITSPDGQCVIYQEQFNNIDMTNSNGIFDVAIGTGSVQYMAGSATTVIDVFNNSQSYQCGTCSPGPGNGYTCSASLSAPYGASPADGRLLRVAFHDGSGWNTVIPDTQIRAVPYAGYSFTSYKLGSHTSADFMLKADVPTACGVAGNFLTWDSVQSKFTCSTLPSAGGGTITEVTAGTGLSGGGTSGNVTVSLSNTTVSAGSYGSATQVPVITIDAQGRITGATNTTISGVAPTGAAGGDLSGSYPSPTIANNAVTSAKIATGTIVAGNLDFTGSNVGTSGLVVKDSNGKFYDFGCSSDGQVPTWTVSGWACQAISVNGSSFGSQAANTFLAAPNGSAGNPAFRKIASADLPITGATGVFTNGGNSFGTNADLGTNDANALGLKTNGTTQLNITSTGDVGIGIGTATPSAKLHVAAKLTANSGTSINN